MSVFHAIGFSMVVVVTNPAHALVRSMMYITVSVLFPQQQLFIKQLGITVVLQLSLPTGLVNRNKTVLSEQLSKLAIGFGQHIEIEINIYYC